MLNRKQFIREVAKKEGKRRKDVDEAIDLVLGGIRDAIKNHNGVKFIGFGTFTTIETKARQGSDPNTHELVFYESNTLPKFKPSRALEEYIKQKPQE